jgi:hypothetical protein
MMKAWVLALTLLIGPDSNAAEESCGFYFENGSLTLAGKVFTIESYSDFAERIVPVLYPEDDFPEALQTSLKNKWVETLAVVMGTSPNLGRLRGIAYGLLFNHPSTSRLALNSIGRAVGSSFNVQEMESFMPIPFEEEDFHRWKYLGDSFEENDEFLARVEESVRNSIFEKVHSPDGATFESVFPTGRNDIVESLRKLKSPSVIGQWIEILDRTDKAVHTQMARAIFSPYFNPAKHGNSGKIIVSVPSGYSSPADWITDVVIRSDQLYPSP